VSRGSRRDERAAAAINHYIVTPFIGATPQNPPRTFDASTVTRVITGLAQHDDHIRSGSRRQNSVGTAPNSPGVEPRHSRSPRRGEALVGPREHAVRVNWVAPANNGSPVRAMS
jgi:hypothetical protein